MIVRPTVLGGILIAIIVLVAASAVIIWWAANRIGEFIDIAKDLIVVYQHNVGKTVARTDADDADTAPVPLPPNPPLVQNAHMPAVDEWRTQFRFNEPGDAA